MEAAETLDTPFESWEHFKGVFNVWCETNGHLFTVKNSRTVEKANKNIRPGQPLYDARFKYSYVRFECKHSGQYRARGSGIRPRQTTFKKECPAFFLLTVDRKKDRMVVKGSYLQHNHTTSLDIFRSYPEVRRLSMLEKEETSNLLSLDADIELIRQYLIKKSDKCITKKDLYNFRASLRREQTEETMMMKSLEAMLDEDPKYRIQLFMKGNTISAIYIQSQMMADTFGKFPEMLEMDTTYRVNDRKMTLTSLLVQDGNGRGYAVAQCLLADEGKENMLFFLNSFKTLNPSSNRIRSFIIDKDFTELQCIKQVFPEADILLCTFHVMRTFRRQVAKLNILMDSKEKLQKLLQKMVYAQNEETYMNLREELIDVAPEDFVAYFKKNWDDSTCMWAHYKTCQVTNLGQNTTNMIEAYHSKLKLFVKSSHTMSGFLTALHCYNRGKAELSQDNATNVQTKISVCAADGPEQRKYREFCTPYAAQKIIEQMHKSLDYDCTPEEGSSTFKVHNKKTNAKYTLKDDTCTCTFFVSQMLPCRHIFAKRKTHNEALFSESLVHPRWQSDYNHSEAASGISQITSRTERKKRSANLSRNEKFKKMLAVCKEIAEVCCEHSQQRFTEELEFMSSFRDSLKGPSSDLHVCEDQLDMGTNSTFEDVFTVNGKITAATADEQEMDIKTEVEWCATDHEDVMDTKTSTLEDVFSANDEIPAVTADEHEMDIKTEVEWCATDHEDVMDTKTFTLEDVFSVNGEITAVTTYEHKISASDFPRSRETDGNRGNWGQKRN